MQWRTHMYTQGCICCQFQPEPTQARVHRDTDTDKWTWTLLARTRALIIQTIIHQNSAEDSGWPTRNTTYSSRDTLMSSACETANENVSVLPWLLTLHITAQRSLVIKTSYKPIHQLYQHDLHSVFCFLPFFLFFWFPTDSSACADKQTLVRLNRGQDWREEEQASQMS